MNIARQTKIVLGLMIPNVVFIVMILSGLGLILTGVVWGLYLSSILTMIHFDLVPDTTFLEGNDKQK